MKTLRDWLPNDFQPFGARDDRLLTMLDVEVKKDFSCGSDDEDSPLKHRWFPFKHKHVHNWCILANGYAVAWNENPSIGWSFPFKKFDMSLLDTVDSYVKCVDKAGNDITDGDLVDVQQAGVFKVYSKEDGQLWFNPYPEKFGEQRVSEYFSGDLLLV